MSKADILAAYSNFPGIIHSTSKPNYYNKNYCLALDKCNADSFVTQPGGLILNEDFVNNQELVTTFVVVILTDGFENSSRRYTLEDIRTMITRLEATGNWTFSFIGATLDAVDIAEQMSIKRQNSFIFSKDQMKEEVWDKLSNSMHGYFDKKRSGKDLGNLFDK